MSYKSFIIYASTDLDETLCNALGYHNIHEFNKLLGKKHKATQNEIITRVVDAIKTNVIPHLKHKSISTLSTKKHVISDLHDVLDYNIIDLLTGTFNQHNCNVFINRINELVKICSSNNTSFNVMSYVGKTRTMIIAYYIIKPLLELGYVSSLTLCSKLDGSLSENTKGWCTQNFFDGQIIATFDDNEENGISFNLAAPESFMFIENDSSGITAKMVNHIKKRLI